MAIVRRRHILPVVVLLAASVGASAQSQVAGYRISARLRLKWLARCGVLCGLWFDHERVVVLTPEGDPLAIFGDENIPITVS